MDKRYNTKHFVTLAMLLAVAFVLSWIEYMIALPMIIPGIKIGLANLAILFSLYYCGSKDTISVLLGRLLLNALLFGNIVSLIYSAAGGLLSYIIMSLCKKILNERMVGVSIIGGVVHNIGQLAAAMVVLRTIYILYYLPYLIVGGIAAGAVNGFVVKKILSCSYFSVNHSE